MAKELSYRFRVMDDEYNVKYIFDKIDIKKYNDIQSFIKDNFVNSILVSTILNKNIGGSYKKGVITVIINPSVNNLKILTSKDEKSIYFLLSGIYSTLLHELQHAYDDYRSKGKFIKKNFTGKKLETYYRSNHELNAYFTDTISKVVFYTVDYEETPTSIDDGIVIVIRKINDFNIIKQNFINQFKGWSYLTEDIKKKIIHRLGKYYIMVNEKIQKYNKEKHTKDFS